ncbi:Dabb family protein [Streptomyces sp. NPDC002573]|uniref:Dabb family protein n=1 Tax=Streptomyces sp. NPDC002573 TaxID=3364651 RepID=UPI0036AA90D3
MDQPRIHHMVVFSLRHEAGSEPAETFMRDAERQLTKIPTVKEFRAFRLRPNNPLDYGISMVFDNDDAYQEYAAHPLHEDFELHRWQQEATHALVIDYES